MSTGATNLIPSGSPESVSEDFNPELVVDSDEEGDADAEQPPTKRLRISVSPSRRQGTTGSNAEMKDEDDEPAEPDSRQDKSAIPALMDLQNGAKDEYDGDAEADEADDDDADEEGREKPVEEDDDGDGNNGDAPDVEGDEEENEEDDEEDEEEVCRIDPTRYYKY